MRERLGLEIRSSGSLDWMDGYVAPHLTCEMEDAKSIIEDSQASHNFHIPRICHLEIASHLTALAENPEQIEHALFHQVMSGRNVRYNTGFRIHYKVWSEHIKSDYQRESFKRISEEMSRVDSVVYKDGWGPSYEITVLEMSYDFVHGEPQIYDIVIPFTFIFIILWLSGRILLGYSFWY